MKHALAVLAILAITVPVFAQDAPKPPTDALASATPPAPATSAPPAAHGGGKVVIERCRDEAGGQGLEGEAKRDAVSACVVRQRPDLAGRMQCRKQGFEKGLRKEELHAFVRQCLSGNG